MKLHHRFEGPDSAPALVVGLGALHHTDPVAANAALSGNLLMSAFGVLLGGFIANRVRQHRLLASVGLSASVIAC